MLRHIALSVTFAAAAFLWSVGPSSTLAADNPDVLFIAIDDLNDWVGHLGGYPGVKTPNIDALAKRGVSFTNAHCVAPACNPSRAGLLSGLRPFTTGIYHNNHDWKNTLADILTLPQFYRQQGYHVLGGGKIFHGSGVIDRYWDDYYNRKELPSPKVPYNGLNKAHFDWSPLDIDEIDMPDYKLVTWASDVLKQPQGEKPLFLAVGIVKPHLPWFAPQKYFDMYPLDEITLPQAPEEDLDDVPALGVKMARPEGDHKAVTEANEWRKAVQAYLATITFVDDQVGRLMKALDESGRADNTVIVLWGDHGWHLGEKQHWRKFSLWEEATRAPLMFVAPGVTSPNQRCPAPVDFLSIYPTLADLCGLPLPTHLEGKSLRPLLENPGAAWKTPALTTHGRGNHGVRDARWRYIRYRDGSEELYDHQTDPMEWTNLAPSADNAKKRSLARTMPTEEVPEAPKAERYRKR